MQNMTKFLLELGNGFAFVGQQYKITVDKNDFKKCFHILNCNNYCSTKKRNCTKKFSFLYSPLYESGKDHSLFLFIFIIQKQTIVYILSADDKPSLTLFVI